LEGLSEESFKSIGDISSEGEIDIGDGKEVTLFAIDMKASDTETIVKQLMF